MIWDGCTEGMKAVTGREMRVMLRINIFMVGELVLGLRKRAAFEHT